MATTPTNGSLRIRLNDRTGSGRAEVPPAPRGLRNGGIYPHDKPTEGPGQWLLRPSGDVPGPAFPMRDDLTRMFIALSKAAPAGADGIQEVRRIGREMFNQVWEGTEGQVNYPQRRSRPRPRLHPRRDSLSQATRSLHFPFSSV